MNPKVYLAKADHDIKYNSLISYVSFLEKYIVVLWFLYSSLTCSVGMRNATKVSTQLFFILLWMTIVCLKIAFPQKAEVWCSLSYCVYSLQFARFQLFYLMAVQIKNCRFVFLPFVRSSKSRRKTMEIWLRAIVNAAECDFLTIRSTASIYYSDFYWILNAMSYISLWFFTWTYEMFATKPNA